MNSVEKIEILAALSVAKEPLYCDMCKCVRDPIAFHEESKTCDICLAHLASYMPYDEILNRTFSGINWNYMFMGEA